MLKKLILAIAVISLNAGCALGKEVKVKTHYNLFGPTVWEATDGTTSVTYYNGNCCCVAEEVLESLARQANQNELHWPKMADEKFKKAILNAECKIQKEIRQ